MRRSLRSWAGGLIALGLVLLALGFVFTNDLLGLGFMICAVLGVLLFIVDLVRGRRAS